MFSKQADHIVHFSTQYAVAFKKSSLIFMVGVSKFTTR